MFQKLLRNLIQFSAIWIKILKNRKRWKLGMIHDFTEESKNVVTYSVH